MTVIENKTPYYEGQLATANYPPVSQENKAFPLNNSHITTAINKIFNSSQEPGILTRLITSFRTKSPVQTKGKETTPPALINIIKLAKSFGISPYTENEPLRKMAASPKLLSHLEYLAEKESFERSMAACLQEVCIDDTTIFGGEEKVLTSIDGTNKVAVKILGLLGQGRYNKVNLAWNISERKFIAIRSEINEKNSNRQEFIDSANKVRSFYEQVKSKITAQELELIENTDSLVKEETGDRVFSLRELASHGDLTHNEDTFKKAPKELISLLLQQLILYIKSNIAMGDVKPSNINIHKDTQGKITPKYSDIDGGLCADLSTQKLLQAWSILKKEVEGTDYDLDSILKDAAYGCKKSFPNNECLLEAYSNFKKECESLTNFSRTLKYTFNKSESKWKEFSLKNQKLIIEAFSSTETNTPKTVEKYVLTIVQRVQQLDIKATGIVIIMNLLGEESFEKYKLGNIPQHQDVISQLRSDLKHQQNRLSRKDRLSKATIQFIIDMTFGRISSSEEDIEKMKKNLSKI
jgi:hypothetical protein